MLVSLQIENIAVIEKAAIAFDAGFNALTGETGAGKSIVIDAINAVLGERISRDLVRTGSRSAGVSALFTDLSAGVSAALEELGYPPDEEGALLVQRTISADGKGTCRINGQLATVSILRSVGRLLVNIHGQHENQALLSPERHVEYLDRLGGLLPLLEEYRAAYRTMCGVRSRLEAADMDEAEKARRLDMLRFQTGEIEAAALQAGEEEALTAQRTLYRNAEKIAGAVIGARAALSGDEETEGALSGISRAASAVRDAARYMEGAGELAQRMETALYELEECAGELRDYAQRLDFDPSELDETESRLEAIHRLKMKYGGTVEEILAYYERAQQELEAIETSDLLLSRLTKELEAAEAAAREKAAALTAARREAAARFSRDVMEELAFLDMPGVSLEVAMEPVPLGTGGGDRVEFLIAANPGEPPKPIARIASGGELSRIMLAIKSVLADADDIDTLIFDEIDTGISGRAARKVGIKLRQTAASRQVLCVTHLAQIASLAHHHLLISKTVREGRTYTEVTPLDREARERELARIIGGEVTGPALEAAREMLEKAAGESAEG